MHSEREGKRLLRHFYDFRFGRWGKAGDEIAFLDFLYWLIRSSVKEGYHVLNDLSVSRYLLAKRRFSGLSQIENAIFKNRAKSDLQFHQSVTKKSFATWMTDFGEKEYPYLSLLSCTDTRKSGGVFYKYRPDVIIVSPRNRESGVGVLASNVLKQCTDFGLEVSLIEFEYSSYSLDFRAEFYDHAQSAKLVIYCISLIEFNYLYYLVGPGPMKGISFKSVYYGPWELESVPHELTEALGGVGEIWGISQFASRAFAERHPNVGKIGIAVNQEGESLDKASQKSGYFQFLTVCANGSYLERKNPLGVLEAFLAAFPRNCATNYCRLRIHISDLSKFELPAELDTADDRVLITFGTLSRSDYIEMFETSHCYVSLHRAEGFGYAVAEAVDFGLEVITTNSGGILDFCSRDNCYLVGFRKKEIDPKDYPYSRGLYWAEPDLFDAAHAMAQCVSSPKKNLGPNSLEMYSKNVQENLYKRLVSRDLT